jgi:hypothetical protein
MIIKKQIRREPFLFGLIFDLFDPDETPEADPMTDKEFYVFLVSVTIAMFILSYLVTVLTT